MKRREHGYAGSDAATVAAHFDALAPAYAMGPAARLDRARIVSLLGPWLHAGARALDVATGTGAVAWALADRSRTVVAVDVSIGMLTAARAAGRRCVLAPLFLNCDATAIPIVAETFDVITCSRALHHMPNPRLALEEMFRLARPGARLLVVDSLTYDDPDRAARHDAVERLRDPSHVRILSMSELRRHISVAGFAFDSVEIDEHWRPLATWLHDAGADPVRSERVQRWIQTASVDSQAFFQGHFRYDKSGQAAVRSRVAWLTAHKEPLR